jgi:hypothetical protein
MEYERGINIGNGAGTGKFLTGKRHDEMSKRVTINRHTAQISNLLFI